MNIRRKRPSNEGLQEKAFELFPVYYIAMTAHFHFGLLNHNSSSKFHNKNLPFSVALLKNASMLLLLLPTPLSNMRKYFLLQPSC